MSAGLGMRCWCSIQGNLSCAASTSALLVAIGARKWAVGASEAVAALEGCNATAVAALEALPEAVAEREALLKAVALAAREAQPCMPAVKGCLPRSPVPVTVTISYT